MNATIEVESTLTDRYQTTVPETVRRALNLAKRDKIHYAILPDGAVMLTRAGSEEGSDPVMGKFLDFLAQDIANRPETIQAVNTDLIKHIQTLVGDMKVDLDAALSADDE
jgi:antitoxin PrlF